MNSDDSSMGVNQPSIARRRDDPGCGSIQLPKDSKGYPNSLNVVCDDSYAPAAGGKMQEVENRRNALNDAFKTVSISGRPGKGSNAGDFSCFGFLLPKSEETYEGDNTKSRAFAHQSSDESKLGKRLLSAVAGGQSDFSAMMGQQPELLQPSKFRKIDEDMDSNSGSARTSTRKAVSTMSSGEPILPARKTMTEGMERTKTLNSKRIQVGGSISVHTSSNNMMDDPVTQAEWQARFQQREKQIEMGKATKGYQVYTKSVKREKRTPADPQTPDSREMCSKRQFDGKLHKWRKGLHQYDPDNSMT